MLTAVLARNSRFSRQNQAADCKGLFRCGNPVHNRIIMHGDARVSTDGQNVDAEVRQLLAVGARQMFWETRKRDQD